jgi:hypothetical protein
MLHVQRSSELGLLLLAQCVVAWRGCSGCMLPRPHHPFEPVYRQALGYQALLLCMCVLCIEYGQQCMGLVALLPWEVVSSQLFAGAQEPDA